MPCPAAAATTSGVRIEPRRQRTQTAVAHGILAAVWHVLTTNTAYHDLGSDYVVKRDNPDHRGRRAVNQLEGLGYHVTLEPLAG